MVKLEFIHAIVLWKGYTIRVWGQVWVNWNRSMLLVKNAPKKSYYRWRMKVKFIFG